MKNYKENCKDIWRTADAICFDVDSTVCVDEAIDELAKYVGKSQEVSDITKKAMQGGANFRQALAQRLDIIKPSRQLLIQFMEANRPKLTDKIKELIELLHDLGRDVYLISGGFDVIIEAAAEILNIPFENIYANSILFHEDGSYAGFDESRPTSNQDGKAQVISMLKKTKNYNKVVMIGDGMTDLEASPPADAFIGFGGNQIREKVRDRSDWFVYGFGELIRELPLPRIDNNHIKDNKSFPITNAQGFAIFKLHDDKKLSQVEKLAEVFQKGDNLDELVTLQHFEKFKSTNEAVNSAASLMESKMGKKLKKAIKKAIVKPDLIDHELAVADPKLGLKIKEKFNINCVSSNTVQELMSLIRFKIEDLIPEWSNDDDMVLQLGTAHGIGRFKLKFSPDKVDTMIVQAVSLIDDLDKELNNYIMRCREWYGWHFPELSKILPDHTTYIKTILKMGMRSMAPEADFEGVIDDEETVKKIKEYAEISMGTDIANEDMDNILQLCQNIIELTEYRARLYDYLKNRMMTIAPNLTILVGELVGARLVARAGSLMNLSKYPASTIQILGAEKALFRALKTKHDTPKYGLIYHAQLVGQSNIQLKGKMSRMLAAKSALATRVDAFGEEPSNALGTKHRAKLESRLRLLEDNKLKIVNGHSKRSASKPVVEHKSKKFKASNSEF